jgi:hypothetical protein
MRMNRYDEWAKSRDRYICDLAKMNFFKELIGGNRKMNDKLAYLGMRFADGYVPYMLEMGRRDPIFMYEVFDESVDLIDNPYDNDYVDYVFDKKMWDKINAEDKKVVK